MDARTFIAFRSSLTSRRGALAHLGGGLLGTQTTFLGNQDVEARTKRSRKRKRKNRKGQKAKVAATCPGSGLLSSGTDSGNNRIAQTFVALASGPLVKARLAMFSAFESTGDFELRLVEVDGLGVPTDKVLATSTVARDRVPNERTDIDFTFAKPIAIKAGVEYGLVLTRPGGGIFAWFGEEDRRCPGDPFFSPDQDEPFNQSTAANFDHTFTVFVRS
jgi:hypothetical protein